MLEFALTIFTGAFLLFQVQPLIGKFILPWFGGTPAVWTSCVLFFQLVLLGGYAYAHLSARFLKPRVQAVLHLALLAAALVSLPIIPAAAWKPAAGAEPVWGILRLLLACVGLPYFVLSTTGPLMQEWFRRLNPATSPYRLYALSNLGSLLALMSYPFVFEPNLTRRAQAAIWSWGLGLFAVLCAWCAWRLWKASPSGLPPEGPAEVSETPDATERTEPPSLATKALWLVLPACASVLLLAITNTICQDVAVIPFLWVLPLALYLLSFVICFDSPGFYSRRFFAIAFFASAALVGDLLYEGMAYPLFLQLGICCAALFFGCMICHGEVYRLKPPPRHLTGYYLTISAGGAVGGLFVAVLAPLIFNWFVELHLGLWLCALLLVLLCARDKTTASIAGRMVAAWKVALVATLLLGAGLGLQALHAAPKALVVTRNFYGVLRVWEETTVTPEDASIILTCGNILHGLQFKNPARSAQPTSYYHERSGIGLALAQLHRPAGRRIGLVGLGAGTLASYGQTGDYIRYYEINPKVKQLAETYFSFLSNSKARIEVILGDARLFMENEPPQQFDLLVVDAFTSDAIPVHLLTREAMDVYLRHLKPDGILAFHLSNGHLNLRPIAERLAAEVHLPSAMIYFRPQGHPWWMSSSDWLLLTRDTQFLGQEAIRTAQSPPLTDLSRAPLWTDEYTSLFKALK